MAAWSETERGKVKSGMFVSEFSKTQLEGFRQGGREKADASEGVAV